MIRWDHFHERKTERGRAEKRAAVTGAGGLEAHAGCYAAHRGLVRPET